MEVQLQELVTKIKRDGVAAAEEQAAAVIKAAEEKAKNIIADAENEAQIAVKKAEAEAERFRKAAESSIEQAGRNTLIAFRQGVLHELEALVNMETAQSYNAEVLKTLIPETVKLWIKNNNTDDLSVILSPQDLKKLESSLHSALKDAVSNGLEIKADGKMSGGFRIGTKNG